MVGLPAKWGYYARDHDPSKHTSGKPGYDDGEWKVDVEAWPYTSEAQNILALDRYEDYKQEAGAPPGSRCRMGPLMTDYFTAYPIEKFDESNNRLYVIVDKNGQLRYGRSDEGAIISDTAVTLMDHWKEGESLANPELWGRVTEDPFRRFKLRGFFATGRSALGPGGNELISSWRRQDWKLEELDSNKFWDDYKLARKVALREELFGEPIWRDVVAPIDAKYREEAATAAARIRSAPDEATRLVEIRKSRRLYTKWRTNRRREIFDYSDQVFWNGVMSTHAFSEAEIKKSMMAPGEFDINDPSTVISRIVSRAKSRSVNLVGKYSSVRQSQSNLTHEMSELQAQIAKDRAKLEKKLGRRTP